MQVDGGVGIIVWGIVINIMVANVWKYKSCSPCLFFWLKILPG